MVGNLSQRFLSSLGKGVLILDGAMGTMLQRYGLTPGECPELMNLNAPEVVANIHAEYVAAGAQCVETNTFGGSPICLARYGLEQKAAEINRAAVENARRAVGRRTLVLGAIGPLGELLEPYGDVSEAMARAAFGVQVEAFAASGVDACIVETMSDLNEARLAVEVVSASGLPVIAQMSYDQSGRTFMGVDPSRAAGELVDAGACVVGANCSVGPQEMLSVVRALRAAVSVPISALPNAGLPEVVGGNPTWPLTPCQFAEWGLRLVASGAGLIGGCCGTTPQHIARLVEALNRPQTTEDG